MRVKFTGELLLVLFFFLFTIGYMTYNTYTMSNELEFLQLSLQEQRLKNQELVEFAEGYEKDRAELKEYLAEQEQINKQLTIFVQNYTKTYVSRLNKEN